MRNSRIDMMNLRKDTTSISQECVEACAFDKQVKNLSQRKNEAINRNVYDHVPKMSTSEGVTAYNWILHSDPLNYCIELVDYIHIGSG